jgi:hypothetical protein
VEEEDGSHPKRRELATELGYGCHKPPRIVYMRTYTGTKKAPPEGEARC